MERPDFDEEETPPPVVLHPEMTTAERELRVEVATLRSQLADSQAHLAEAKASLAEAAKKAAQRDELLANLKRDRAKLALQLNAVMRSEAPTRTPPLAPIPLTPLKPED